MGRKTIGAILCALVIVNIISGPASAVVYGSADSELNAGWNGCDADVPSINNATWSLSIQGKPVVIEIDVSFTDNNLGGINFHFHTYLGGVLLNIETGKSPIEYDEDHFKNPSWPSDDNSNMWPLGNQIPVTDTLQITFNDLQLTAGDEISCHVFANINNTSRSTFDSDETDFTIFIIG